MGVRRRFLSDPDANWLIGPIELPFVDRRQSSGEAVYLQYPLVRLVIFAASVAIGVVMWLALNRTRVGMMVRAGVDDRDILAATGSSRSCSW